MRSTLFLLLAAAASATVGAATEPKHKPVASAALMLADGTRVGLATLTETSSGLKLVVAAHGLPPGVHGVHLHTTGLCDGPDFKTAGGHWNPMHKMHGKDAPGGPHMGDLPNMTVAGDGTAKLKAMIPQARLMAGDAPLLDADGAAVVIHAAADDYKTDPSGNSGARIACGVLKPS